MFDIIFFSQFTKMKTENDWAFYQLADLLKLECIQRLIFYHFSAQYIVSELEIRFKWFWFLINANCGRTTTNVCSLTVILKWKMNAFGLMEFVPSK